MDLQQEEIEQFWKAFVDSQPEGNETGEFTYTAWGFGNTPEMTDELGGLVLQGTKTATCGLLWEYEADGEPLPEADQFSIILNGSGKPLCVIQTIGAEVKPFREVGESFAWEEGEDDRSLAYWREVHWKFFSPICARLGREPDQDMPLVCKRFRRVYP